MRLSQPTISLHLKRLEDRLGVLEVGAPGHGDVDVGPRLVEERPHHVEDAPRQEAGALDAQRRLAVDADHGEAAGGRALAEFGGGDLHRGFERRAREIGERLATDAALQQRVDTRVADAAVFLVDRYRHDIASIITRPKGSGQSIGKASARALPRKSFFCSSLISPMNSTRGWWIIGSMTSSQ